ncbi:MAG: hypothetical protein IT306_17670 [Chloroflexi bacterium]|nr:hypothetical protein [Chloroflexota bacterium]
MLRQVLQSLADGRVTRPDELARSLGVSIRLLGPMLDDLQRRGYLAPLAMPCASPCESCPIAAACTPAQARLWTLTAHGRTALSASSTRNQAEKSPRT